MKRLLSAILAVLLIASAFASCDEKNTESTPETTVSTTSSEADVYGEWLTERLGYAPENVILGIGSDANYGIDMTDFEEDGYILRTVSDTTLVFGKSADGLDRAVRAYAKAVENDMEDGLNETYHEGYRIKRLTIAGRDISEYIVYYTETENENIIFSANDFVRLVEEATGVKLPIVVGEAVAPAIEFRTSDDPALKDEGYVYTVNENGLLIEGAAARGCMNGMYRFLEIECGWDRLTYRDAYVHTNHLQAYGESYLNEADHIDIPVGTTDSGLPAFDYYNIYNPFNTYSYDRATPLLSQVDYGAIPQALHGLSTHNFYNHSSFNIQPCFTSEDEYEVFRYNIENYILANYGKNPAFKYVDIAQYDTTDFCFCETCMEVYIEEGYTNAGALVRLANRISEEMDEMYPGLVYLIFAYLGTNAPPTKTVPNDLVYVTYCFDLNCSNHTIDGKNCNNTEISQGRKSTDYAKWFEGWCDLTDNIYVWYYTLGTGIHAYTVLDNIYDDYKYFVEMGVKGVFLESENYGEFGIKRIENQLAGAMVWDNDMTREEFDAVYCELLEAEYGPGWSLVYDYVRSWNAAQDIIDCWHCWGWESTGFWNQRYSTFYYAGGFDEYCNLIEAAIRMAESKAQEGRLNRLYVTVLYSGCFSSYYPAYLAGDTERMEVLAERYLLCMQIVRDLGFNPAALPTIGYNPTNYAMTIEEAAWKSWLEWFPIITGQPLPEDAPIIK